VSVTVCVLDSEGLWSSSIYHPVYLSLLSVNPFCTWLTAQS